MVWAGREEDMIHVLTVNTPGYMPDSEPMEFDSRGEALAARRDEMIYGVDQLADTYGEFHPIVSQWLDSLDSHDDAVHLPMSDSAHDLGVVFEISPLGL